MPDCDPQYVEIDGVWTWVDPCADGIETLLDNNFFDFTEPTNEIDYGQLYSYFYGVYQSAGEDSTVVVPLTSEQMQLLQGLQLEQPNLTLEGLTPLILTPADEQAFLEASDLYGNLQLYSSQLPDKSQFITYSEITTPTLEFIEIYALILDAFRAAENVVILTVEEFQLLLEILFAKKKDPKEEERKKKEAELRLLMNKRNARKRECNLKKLLKEAVERSDALIRGGLTAAARAILAAMVKNKSLTASNSLLPKSLRDQFPTDLKNVSIKDWDDVCAARYAALDEAIRVLEEVIRNLK